MGGGKDSTVLIDKKLRDGFKFDYVIFSDTKIEFDIMYEYIEKVKKYHKKY